MLACAAWLKSASKHVFKCSEQTFWTKVFFDDDYNRRLFQEILKFPVWRVAKTEERGDEVLRTIVASPPVGDLPSALKAVVGDNAGYEERGVFNKKTHRYQVQVVPNRTERQDQRQRRDVDGGAG